MDACNPNRDIINEFVETVADWIKTFGEVLVVLRYLHAAGKKDFALCNSEREFRRIIELVPAGTDIIVIRDKQLPLRGMVTRSLIDRALAAIPEGNEYLVVRISGGLPDDPRLSGEMGDTHHDLREDLEREDVFGTNVAIGLCPPFMEADNPGMVSASKGGIDGPR
jgi:hypothetical protein